MTTLTKSLATLAIVALISSCGTTLPQTATADDKSSGAVALPKPPGNPNAPLPLEVSVADAKPLLDEDGVYWIDCREKREWNDGHIDGATLHPTSEFAEHLAKLADKKGQRIVVYCAVGGRSMRITKLLRENGFAKAQSMAGGIRQWTADGLPVSPGDK